MADATLPGDGPWEWAEAASTHTGERNSGDRALVVPRQDGLLVAVVDGLGHGDDAAEAARVAVECIAEHPDDELSDIIHQCHVTLRGTRGVVAALAVLREDGRMTWTGVGNVEAVVARRAGAGRPREHALLFGGVIGAQLPRIRPSDAVLEPDDRVVFATDGIDRAFVNDLVLASAEVTAQQVLRRHASGRDDALVLVGRYRGSGR